ncbi:vesicular-fusion protein S17 [Entomophthora muscae]|uniref:Vesicular-fusion protein S17 n=1 Tax=Entomophthora muscae TaxID=34485 RepID=A0ACC2ULW8_9FUNG|nr:vesicular-fusion protein S17 [Entomophthora muscae]
MSENQARKYLAEAQAKETHKGWFGGNKLDEAFDLYQQAGNSFKLAKCWKDAGEAFESAAKVAIKLGEQNDAATQFINASKAFKKDYPQEAINCLKLAVDILTQRGRFHSAATHQKEIAALYETELSNLSEAMAAYELAGEWYGSEDSKAIANSCNLKVAEFAAQLEQYPKAIAIFEKVASDSINNQLAKWSVKEYFFKAGLCHLVVGDPISTQRAFEQYEAMDSSFSQTRECKLLRNLIDAIEQEDVEAFTEHVFEFDQISKLDNWKTSLLLRVKKSIGDESLT